MYFFFVFFLVIFFLIFRGFSYVFSCRFKILISICCCWFTLMDLVAHKLVVQLFATFICFGLCRKQSTLVFFVSVFGIYIESIAIDYYLFIYWGRGGVGGGRRRPDRSLVSIFVRFVLLGLGTEGNTKWKLKQGAKEGWGGKTSHISSFS